MKIKIINRLSCYFGRKFTVIKFFGHPIKAIVNDKGENLVFFLSDFVECD